MANPEDDQEEEVPETRTREGKEQAAAMGRVTDQVSPGDCSC